MSNFFPPAEREDPTAATQVLAPTDDLEEDYDDEFAPQPRQKLGKFSGLLAAVLVLGLGFLGGILVQKHTGSSSSSRTPTFSLPAGARAGTGTGGAGTGRTGGFGGFGGGAPGGGADATSSAGPAGSGSGAAAGNLAVVGQIVSVSGDTVVVKNLGGKQVTVHLSGDTKITITVTAASLKAGQTVAVSGTTGADGSVSATSVTGQ